MKSMQRAGGLPPLRLARGSMVLRGTEPPPGRVRITHVPAARAVQERAELGVVQRRVEVAAEEPRNRLPSEPGVTEDGVELRGAQRRCAPKVGEMEIDDQTRGGRWSARPICAIRSPSGSGPGECSHGEQSMSGRRERIARPESLQKLATLNQARLATGRRPACVQVERGAEMRGRRDRAVAGGERFLEQHDVRLQRLKLPGERVQAAGVAAVAFGGVDRDDPHRSGRQREYFLRNISRSLKSSMRSSRSSRGQSHQAVAVIASATSSANRRRSGRAGTPTRWCTARHLW